MSSQRDGCLSQTATHRHRVQGLLREHLLAVGGPLGGRLLLTHKRPTISGAGGNSVKEGGAATYWWSDASERLDLALEEDVVEPTHMGLPLRTRLLYGRRADADSNIRLARQICSPATAPLTAGKCPGYWLITCPAGAVPPDDCDMSSAHTGPHGSENITTAAN